MKVEGQSKSSRMSPLNAMKVEGQSKSLRMSPLNAMKVEGQSKSSRMSPLNALSPRFPPSYDWVTGESERGELGTVVTEFSTVTTRTRYRVGDD